MSATQKIPVDVVHLLPVLDDMLINLLKSLASVDWQTQTIAERWVVKDVAAHLLDGNIRLLSMLRDGHYGESLREQSHAELVGFLNRLNADWVQAMQRVSPQMLILLHELSGKMYCAFMETLRPFDPAPFPVDWAGERESLNWMAIAREYAEKWLHQQQIRDALGMPGLMTREFFRPFMDISMLALPHTYRRTHAPEGTMLELCVTSDTGGSWWIRRSIGRWKLTDAAQHAPDARIELDPDTAWKLFSKSVRPQDVIGNVEITGDRELAEVALGMVAVMA